MSGIGKAVALAFAELGGRLALVGRTTAGARDVAAAVAAAGGEALALEADVRDYEALAGATTSALERFGRLDVLCANAGIADQSRAHEGDPERWRAVVET